MIKKSEKEKSKLLKQISLIGIGLLFVFTAVLSVSKVFKLSFALTNNMGTSEWYEDYTKEIDPINNTITLTRYNGESTVVTVPSKAVIDGVNYQTIISGWVYQNNTSITKVTFENGVVASTTLRGLFNGCSNLTEVNFNNFDTSQVENMNYMFRGCSKLKNVDLSKFNTTNVTTMKGMFNSSGLVKLDLSKFNTPNLQDMTNMFADANSLVELDMSGIDTTNVTKMYTMFPVYSLKKIVLGSKTDFKTNTEGTVGSFGRGIWLRQEDGKEYNAIDISRRSSGNNVAGTYTKVSNFISEMNVNYSVTYKINKLSKIDRYETTNNNIVVTNNNKSIFLTNLSVADNDDYKAEGKITLYFDNVVDDANGNKYTLKVTIDNIHIYDINVDKGYDNFVCYIVGIGQEFGIQSYLYTDTSKSNHIYEDSATKYDFTFEIVDSNGAAVDGSYIFSVYDLDIPSTRDIGSVYSANDLGYGSYSEGVNLLEGFDMPTVKVAENTFLTRNGDRFTGTRYDTASELSELVVKAYSTKSKFTWTGQVAGSIILAQYQPEKVYIEKQDEKGNKLAGAQLKLYYGDGTSEEQVIEDTNGNKVWTSTTTSKSFFLMPGNYTLKEVSTPEGYNRSSDIHFSVGNGIEINNSPVEKIIMKDVPKEYKYIIYHVEKDNPNNVLGIEPETSESEENKVEYGSIVQVQEKEFAGYKYDSKSKEQIQIQTDETKNIAYVYYVKLKGEVIAEYRDKKTGEKLTDDEIIGGPVGDTYKTSSKDIKDYKLVEVKGDETGEFTEETKKVIYYYEKIKGYSPQTGDTREIGMWIALGTISVVGIVAIAVYFIKKKK